jgi:hypothetical protein
MKARELTEFMRSIDPEAEVVVVPQNEYGDENIPVPVKWVTHLLDDEGERRDVIGLAVDYHAVWESTTDRERYCEWSERRREERERGREIEPFHQSKESKFELLLVPADEVEKESTRCSWKGCEATADHATRTWDWTWCEAWDIDELPNEGWYCPEHAKAVEELALVDGDV